MRGRIAISSELFDGPDEAESLANTIYSLPSQSVRRTLDEAGYPVPTPSAQVRALLRLCLGSGKGEV